MYAKWTAEENTDDIKWELNGGSYKNGTLPTSVSRRYTLPRSWELNPPYDGCEFDGWYNNAEFSGNSLTRINSGWKGTLYAKWKALPTDIHTFPSTTQIAVYDLMGRYVGYRLPQNTHGIFIVIQGNKQIKVVL
mgnify:CR=1 FL=1